MMRAGALLVVFVMFLWSDEASAGNEQQLKIGGGNIRIEFGSLPSPSLRKLVIEWVTTSAQAISIYYQKFPVSNVRIGIRFFEGHGTRFGRANGWNGASITMAVGTLNTASDFAKDWEMTHEMVHLAFPSVPESHHWIEEGIATYVEPIARARAGNLSAENVWGDLVDGLPQGLPKAGDRGLDFTPTWGRTYWGGALFCLLADVEIRKRTQNTKGLEHALRAILEAGGTITSDWDLTKALRIGDDATGVSVLCELYEKMKAEPVTVDLQALWRQLGVKREDGRTQFNDSASLAEIRRAITQRAES
jgi:ABC-type transporter Mla MlaB component